MSRYSSKGLRIDDVKVGAEYRARYGIVDHSGDDTVSSSRVRVAEIERVPETHWRPAARKVRKARVTWLNEGTGEPLTGAAATSDRNLYLPARELVQPWEEYAVERDATQKLRQAQQRTIEALGTVGLVAKRGGLRYGDASGVVVTLSISEASDLVKRLEDDG